MQQGRGKKETIFVSVSIQKLFQISVIIEAGSGKRESLPLLVLFIFQAFAS